MTRPTPLRWSAKGLAPPGTAVGVVVLGMHRSGTSAVAGMLVEAGFDGGRAPDLAAGDEGNPRGFFERWSLLARHDALLRQLGASWDVPPTSEQVRAHGVDPELARWLGAPVAKAGRCC
jgi:hypothetical protein